MDYYKADYAASDAQDALKRIRVLESRIETLYAVIRGLCAPGALLGPEIGAKVEKQWADALPKPRPADDAERSKAYEAALPPWMRSNSRLLGS